MIDQGLVLTLILIIGFGLVQVYSSSYIFAIEKFGDGLYFFKRQIFNVSLALIAMFSVACLPQNWIKRAGPFVWAIFAIFVALTLVPGLGVRAGGATRWMSLAGQTFEPSEFLKVAYPLLVASMITGPWAKKPIGDGILKSVILLLPIPILLKQPDFGSVFICLSVVFLMFFIFGLKWRYVLAGAIVSLPAFYFLVWNVAYRKARVLAFLDPWSDPTKSGFQVIQSLLSVHSGGAFGVGLGQGQGKLFFLPEAHTDFTLAVIGEEIGFFGVLILFLIYGFLIFRGFQIGLKNFDTYKRALALGLTMVFTIQVFINVGVVLGLLPTKGLTLPFLSYGGSSIIALGILFGLLLNLARSEE